jgi:hypothetical protein
MSLAMIGRIATAISDLDAFSSFTEG